MGTGQNTVPGYIWFHHGRKGKQDVVSPLFLGNEGDSVGGHFGGGGFLEEPEHLFLVLSSRVSQLTGQAVRPPATGLIGPLAEHGSRLHDGLVKEATGLLCGHHHVNGSRPRTLAHQGYVLGISVELGYVLTDPAKGHHLVLEASIAGHIQVPIREAEEACNTVTT